MATPVNQGEKVAALSPEERRRLYNETVRKANLVNIHLSKLDFNVDRERLTKSESIALNYASSIERFIYNSEKGGCLISVRWRVEMKDGRRNVATCTATYDIAYDGLTTSDESVLRIFAENIATSATYSYFRSLFAMLDWSANLRNPPLPVLKLFPKV